MLILFHYGHTKANEEGIEHEKEIGSDRLYNRYF